MKTFDFHPPDATPIGNTNYSFQTIGGRVHYFANLDPVYSHPEENEHEQSLYIALLAMNRVPVPDLAKAFEKCERTIYRNLRTLRKKGAQAFYHIPQPRGRTAIDADKQAEAEKLLSEGKSIGKTAAELGIHHSTLRHNVKKGWIEYPSAAADADEPETPETAEPESPEAPERIPAPTSRNERDDRDRAAPMGRAAWNVEDRVGVSLGDLKEALPRFDKASCAASGAGVLAALPPLMEEGLPAGAPEYVSVPKGYYASETILSHLAFIILARMTVPEAARLRSPGELGIPLAKDRCPHVKTLRRKIKALAKDRDQLANWAVMLAAKWLEEMSSDGIRFSVDKHFHEYAGRMIRAQRNYMTKRKMSAPSFMTVWLNALGGMPFCCIGKDLNASLVKLIKREIMDFLREIGAVGPDAPNLAKVGEEVRTATEALKEAEAANDPDAIAAAETALSEARAVKPAAAPVFDREAWSPELFLWLDERGVASITWVRGSLGAAWPESEFEEVDVLCHGPLGEGRIRRFLLAERLEELTVDGGTKRERKVVVRHIRRLMPGGKQAAFIATDFSLGLPEVAGAMFSRWSQEIFFKYMIGNFKLGAPAVRQVVDVDPESEVVNPRWREFDRDHKEKKRQISARRDRAGEIKRKAGPEADLEGDSDEAKAFRELENEIASLIREREDLEIKRRGARRMVKAGSLEGKDKIQAFRDNENMFLNLIKMIVYRGESRMGTALQLLGCSRPRSFLRELYKADADVIPDHERGILRVRVIGMADDAADALLAGLFEELNLYETIYPGTNLRMVFEVPPHGNKKRKKLTTKIKQKS